MPASHCPILFPGKCIDLSKQGSNEPRDLEIYSLHAKENHTVTSLAGQFGLDEYTVWWICTRLRTKAALGCGSIFRRE